MADAGVDASLFSKAFGPALDNYESADKDYAAIMSAGAKLGHRAARERRFAAE